MNKGFEIYIQSDLDNQQRESAIAYINKEFIAKTCLDEKFRYFGETGGGYTSGLWRGKLGIIIHTDKTLVFRRLSKNIRKFGVVKLESLEVHNDKPLDKAHGQYRNEFYKDGSEIKKECHCPRHMGSVGVKMKSNIKMDLYARIGNPKG